VWGYNFGRTERVDVSILNHIMRDCFHPQYPSSLVQYIESDDPITAQVIKMFGHGW
jgi:hypothetical protein